MLNFPALKYNPSVAMNVAAFNLPAVIRYAREPLRKSLLQSVVDYTGWPLQESSVDWNGNCSEVLMNIFIKCGSRYPYLTEMDEIGKIFTRKVKTAFSKGDIEMEVRPGVQSIFRHIENLSDWQYCIVSDYWSDITHFMLQSCGVFSKNKLTLTADDALSISDQLQQLILNIKSPENSRIIFINGEQEPLDLKEHQTIHIGMTRSESNFFFYPRFSELFRTLKTLKK